jgi:hypothetical protein
MSFRRRLWHLIPPRIRELYQDGPEIEVSSNLPAETINARIKSAFVDWMTWAPFGPFGSLRNGHLKIGWVNGMERNLDGVIFRGAVIPRGSGCVVIGRMSHDRFTQTCLFVWSFLLVLFGILTIWTIIMPLAVWGMLWLENGMLALTAPTAEEKRAKILAHLHEMARS